MKDKQVSVVIIQVDTREEDYRGKEPVTSQRPSRAGVTLSGTDSTKEADPGEGSRVAQQ